MARLIPQLHLFQHPALQLEMEAGMGDGGWLQVAGSGPSLT